MAGGELMVVGGGPAGLTAALGLARQGHRVHLVEAGPTLGGMAASITVAGTRVDLGSHRLHPVASDRVEGLLNELLGDDLQTRRRRGRLRLADRWVGFPLQATNLIRALPPAFTVAAARDTVMSPLRRRRPALSFADVVSNGLGPAMLDWFYGPYARKLWGREPGELAGELAERRIAASSPGQMLAKVARSVRGDPPVFRYPRLGYGHVTERLADEARAAGVRVLTGAPVRSLELSGRRPRVAVEGQGSVAVDRVMWSAPLGALSRVVSDPPAPPVNLHHRAMVLVYLAYATDRLTPFDAHYLPGPDDLATRISEPKNYRRGPDPEGVSVLCAEVPCELDDPVWSAPPHRLADRLGEDLARLGITEASPVEVARHQLPRVYPVIGVDEVEAVADLRRWAADLPGVTSFGRQGLFVADNLHHVMDMAFAAVDAVGPQGEWNQRAWDRSLAAFEAHVVED